MPDAAVRLPIPCDCSKRCGPNETASAVVGSVYPAYLHSEGSEPRLLAGKAPATVVVARRASARLTFWAWGMMKKRRRLARNTTGAAIAIVLSLVACAKSFDMSGERLTPLGPEWGIVIGSVLVKPVKLADDRDKSRDAADATYEFDIVQSPPGDPDGESPYAERYHLKAKAGEERIFISRLHTGTYLMKNFAQERIVGAGGDLGLVFDSMAGEVRYIGRLLVEVPQRVSRGKEYRFTVENAREATLAGISKEHNELAKQAVDRPLRSREQTIP